MLTQHRPEELIYPEAFTQDPAEMQQSPPRTVPGFSDSEDSENESLQPVLRKSHSPEKGIRRLQKVVQSDSEEEQQEAQQVVSISLPVLSDEEEQESDAAQPEAKNAFAIMAQAAASDNSAKQQKKKAKRSERNNYVQDQANESEEDERFGGFMTGGKAANDDEKEDGSDMDVDLKELVDDAKVDAEVQMEQDLLAGERFQYVLTSCH